MRPRGVSGLAHAFVGREQQLERLARAYLATVEQRRPRLVTILGDAGVGKTRLVRELWHLLPEQDPEPLRRTGRCLSYGTGTAYWALGEVLKEHLGLLESDAPEVVLDRLGGQDSRAHARSRRRPRLAPARCPRSLPGRLGRVLDRCRRRSARGRARRGRSLGRGPAPGFARVRARQRRRAVARDRDRATRTSSTPAGLGCTGPR
ncbi:MAG: AAA family ATPase [Gaiellaceae bacterium]